MSPMPVLVAERVRELRKEIAEINEQNAELLRNDRPDFSGGKERRLQRLKEIKEELMSLTNWKKV